MPIRNQGGKKQKNKMMGVQKQKLKFKKKFKTSIKRSSKQEIKEIMEMIGQDIKMKKAIIMMVKIKTKISK